MQAVVSILLLHSSLLLPRNNNLLLDKGLALLHNVSCYFTICCLTVVLCYWTKAFDYFTITFCHSTIPFRYSIIALFYDGQGITKELEFPFIISCLLQTHTAWLACFQLISVDVMHLLICLQQLENDISEHQSMFSGLNETGQNIIADLEPGEVLTALQSKLDDMNDRWISLGVRVVDIRDR